MTGNLHYRYLNDSPFTPYAGVGIGFTTPHVEVTNTAGTSDTFRYQFGGPAAQVLAGLEHNINDQWSIFGELKFAKFWIDVDLDGVAQRVLRHFLAASVATIGDHGTCSRACPLYQV